MNKFTKAFTLIELLVCFSILAIIVVLSLSVLSGVETSGKLNPMIFPREANAQANQELVEQMAEQNRLMRELLNKQNK
jgi:prepilin-type N-terminal cleavage/methylation domain-containing protein